jgi:putative Mg2+ transporter-C (MgtC) family protein
MPLILGWDQVGLRLLLTLIAGTAIGINRTERGRPAGLRTTLLVCLAASIAMIQTNLLLATAGRKSDSFIMMDLMRLPLGILTGVGFIGAGAILRKGRYVGGLTTAATLWFVTVIGLCFGGGQLGLGAASTGLGLFVLWGLKWVERHLNQEQRGTLTVIASPAGPGQEQIQATLDPEGFLIASCDISYLDEAQRRRLRCDVSWRGHPSDARTPAFVEQLARQPGVLRLQWKPRSI